MRGLRRIKQLETLRALESERARIAQDMHDSLGADLTRIVALADMAQREATETSGLELWGRVGGLARELVDNLNDLVWANNPYNNTLDSLAAYLREHAAEMFDTVGIAYRFEFMEPIPSLPISAGVRRHVYFATKEAVNNILRHSKARTVTIEFGLDGNILRVKVLDDGCGFDSTERDIGHGIKGGNGLRNIEDRIRVLGGTCQIRSTLQGTSVFFSIPLKTNPERDVSALPR